MSFYPLTVVDITAETSQAQSFVLRPSDKDKHLFAYKPGQFLTFLIPLERSNFERCYSLSSSPSTNQELIVTVKRVVGGLVSNWFNDTLKSGDVIRARPPSGRFILRDTRLPVTLFAGGSGITPIISLIKQILHETNLSLRLYYANSHDDQVIFRNELETLFNQFPERAHCYHHLDSRHGITNADMVSEFVKERLNGHFYICGPGPFMELIESVLMQSGVTDEHVFLERFNTPEDLSVGSHHPQSPGTLGHIETFRVTIDDEEHIVPYREGETLLECMLFAGLEPVFSCRDAHCGSCMVIQNSGETIMRKNSVLSKRDKERGYILLCQAVPQTDDIWIDCDA